MTRPVQRKYCHIDRIVIPMWALTLMLSGCGTKNDADDPDDSLGDTQSDTQGDSGTISTDDSDSPQGVETDSGRLEMLDETVALRGSIMVPDASARLTQQELVVQLPNYDPGSLLRCGLNDNDEYRATVEQLGGVRWNYSVSMLEDSSKPIFQKGLPDISRWTNDADMAGEGGAVEIVEADIVGLSEDAALFASASHGLLLADLSGEAPRFVCAAKLPGISKKFYYYNDRLVVMVEGIVPGRKNHSYLLHFSVSSDALTFIEAVDLGVGHVLDSRRFNERLVIYTDLAIEEETPIGDGTSESDAMPMYYNSPHRQLHVFNWGETLVPELSETQINDEDVVQWQEVTPETHTIGDLVHQSSYFNDAIWASDRYFVITENLYRSYLTGFENRSYNRCVEHHTVEIPYTYCYTVYETRPNPNYEPPDNTGGDRSCSGTTLADCLRHVATVSNETIQVPVDRICEPRTRTEYICDQYETIQYTVPQYRHETKTKLAIYEYTTDGFIRFASEVAEIADAGLSDVTLTDSVDTLTTSTEKFDLEINGAVQTLYFQNGFLYVIAKGILQVYAMGENSLVRTSTLNAVDDTLQSSLFTDDTIYLSDFSWNYSVGDTSQLKLVDLSNPGFPTLKAETPELPGGHTHILAIDQGIFTIGRVAQFEGQNIQVLKLGLFGITEAAELSYLILGTDLSNTSISTEKTFTFDTAESRLLLPYSGYDDAMKNSIFRVGISHIEDQLIVSDGALETLELLQRVRKEPGTSRYLGFSNNVIESIVPVADGFELQPVLEYYTPIALYRFTDADDYLEILRLGNQCRFHFARGADINVRNDDTVSEPFACTGASPWAYGHNIIFGNQMGFEFANDYTFAPLSAEQVATLYEALQARPYCLLSTTDRFPWEELRIDFSSSNYTLDDFTCMTPEEYETLAYTFD